MVARLYSLQLLQAFGFGTGSEMSNEMLYIVEGVDPTGRKFAGLYTKAEAEYLVQSNRLNRIIGTKKSS